jgi:hypothetical protein
MIFHPVLISNIDVHQLVPSDVNKNLFAIISYVLQFAVLSAAKAVEKINNINNNQLKYFFIVEKNYKINYEVM